MKQRELRTALAKLHDRLNYIYDEVALGLGNFDGYSYEDDAEDEDETITELTKAELVELVEDIEDRLERIDGYRYQAGKRLAKLKELAEQLD